VAASQPVNRSVAARAGWHASAASAKGPNRLAGARKKSGLRAFLRQHRDFIALRQRDRRRAAVQTKPALART
jgi:hypothetical protein